MNCCCHMFIITLMSRATNDGSRICQHWQRSANCTGHFRCEYNYSNLFIYLLNLYYLYLCICTSAKCMSVELKVYLFIWSHNFQFSMSLSLSPNSLYRQTTDCTEGGGLTREHCIWKRWNALSKGTYRYAIHHDAIIVPILFSKHCSWIWCWTTVTCSSIKSTK
jgi:hypothetical protein